MSTERLDLHLMVGYACRSRNSVLVHPKDDSLYIKSMGNLLCFESLNESGEQKLLHGHDMPVTAIAISDSGSYIASGQMGTNKYKGQASPVIVWDGFSGQVLNTLDGLTVRVNHVSFSQDDRFLCGCGEVSLNTCDTKG
jgi:cilia- and flagella-associated protein 52